MKIINKLFDYIQEKRKLFWFITLFFITFTGCFMFPFRNYLNDFSGYLIYVLYIIYIGLLLIGLIKNNLIKVYLLTFSFSAAGMGMRYILELGEVSNSVNFTIVNIFTFLLIYPASIALYYYLYSLIIPAKNNLKIDK